MAEGSPMRRWRTAVRQQFALARCLDPADGQGFYRRDPTATTVTQQRGARPLRAVRRGAPFRPAPPRVRRLWIVGDVVGAMTIASIVVVIVLWLVHGNVRDFGTDRAVPFCVRGSLVCVVVGCSGLIVGGGRWRGGRWCRCWGVVPGASRSCGPAPGVIRWRGRLLMSGGRW